MENSSSGLKRGLTLVTMFTLMTGAMVGMAWAVLANVLLDRGGPAVILSFVVAAILSIFIGLCYAELCSAMPKAGGEYIYVKRGLKRFPGFITGWILVLAYASMMPGECIIIGKLVNGINPSFSPSITGVIVAIIFTIINLLGVRFSGRIQFLFTLILFGGILAYFGASLPKIDAANFQPFFGRGLGGVAMMIPIAMLAFMGFDILPQAAEEIDAPIRKMVFLIPLSIVFVAFFYIIVTIANAGLQPWEILAKSTESVPIVGPVSIAMGETGVTIIMIAGICGLLTTMNAFLLGGSRLMMAMAKDGELPSPFAYVHPKFGTPTIGILFLGAMGVAGSFIKELIVLFDTASAAILICYLLVVISLLRLRRLEPDMERPYRIWGYPVVPIIAILAIIPTWLISLTLLTTWAKAVFFGWVLIGIGYFILFRNRNNSH
ncbi:MAG: amino acid permease [Deltaproteobacteria bacterium]|nr:amino acid permease [Deltaproteobacteria bacterium]MBT4265808.1 amino acid permease [Deltaproteobacteria bacterium]MBT4638585.1 amino acid permease [Deltaproteobacteria bacterium]MBT6612883.1 amino acid permease [Deltaproteobacteria bacterium]MBT7893111.1 amino acid permease [Deltaproteobacteria bacterium]